MNREKMIGRLQDLENRWDFIVIGGGASGLGIALDAASRGFQTLLLEQKDFAQETSSRSTKLIHGGVRYLRQGRVSLVREALHERAILMQNAPHLVHPLPFLLPSDNLFSRLYYYIGIKLYDLLAGKLSFGASGILSQKEIVQRLPTVKPDRLNGGVCFFDGQFDDARLSINLAQTIVDQGGTVINYMQVQRLLKTGNNKVTGVVARDLESGKEHEIHAKAVINATGVFVDAVRRLDEAGTADSIVPSQGAHIVLDRSFFPGDSAMIIPETADGRVLFAIPWHHRVLIGTTDTPLDKITPEPKPQTEEIDYLLENMRLSH